MEEELEELKMVYEAHEHGGKRALNEFHNYKLNRDKEMSTLGTGHEAEIDVVEGQVEQSTRIMRTEGQDFLGGVGGECRD